MTWIGTLVLENVSGFPHPERLVVLFLIVWGASLCLTVMLMVLGLDARTATYVVFAASVGFLFFGGLVRERGVWQAIGLMVTLVVLVSWLSTREHLAKLVDPLIVAASVALLSGLLISGTESALNYGRSTLEAPEPIHAELARTPNIWLVVTDGYPSSLTLELDLGVALPNQLNTALRDRGFAAPLNAWSGYAFTRLAIPSIFEMDYIATDWVENHATIEDLYVKIAGENQLFQILDRSGYEIHMIEAGWSGGGCGPLVDVCASSRIHNGSLNMLLHDTILTGLPWASPGYHFAVGNQNTMKALEQLAREDSPNSPFFVFAHLIAPHPPLFLDGSCELIVDESRQGFFYPYPGVDPAERDRAFKDQMSCVDEFLLGLSSLVVQDDVLIIVSDHGPDRRAQLARDPSEWSDAALRERMGTLVAVRTPMECSFPEPYVTVNLMRTLLSCLGDAEIALLPPRLFPGPDLELDSKRVRRLLTLSSSP